MLTQALLQALCAESRRAGGCNVEWRIDDIMPAALVPIQRQSKSNDFYKCNPSVSMWWCMTLSECRVAWSLGENKHAEIWFVKIFRVKWRKDGLNKVKINQKRKSPEWDPRGRKHERDPSDQYTNTHEGLLLYWLLLCACFVCAWTCILLLGGNLFVTYLDLVTHKSWDVERPAKEMCVPAALCVWSRAAERIYKQYPTE